MDRMQGLSARTMVRSYLVISSYSEPAALPHAALKTRAISGHCVVEHQHDWQTFLPPLEKDPSLPAYSLLTAACIFVTLQRARLPDQFLSQNSLPAPYMLMSVDSFAATASGRRAYTHACACFPPTTCTYP